jgi:hypothetical protein
METDLSSVPEKFPDPCHFRKNSTSREADGKLGRTGAGSPGDFPSPRPFFLFTPLRLFA